jgi:hypothetical protein
VGRSAPKADLASEFRDASILSLCERSQETDCALNRDSRALPFVA